MKAKKQKIMRKTIFIICSICECLNGEEKSLTLFAESEEETAKKTVERLNKEKNNPKVRFTWQRITLYNDIYKDNEQ